MEGQLDPRVYSSTGSMFCSYWIILGQATKNITKHSTIYHQNKAVHIPSSTRNCLPPGVTPRVAEPRPRERLPGQQIGQITKRLYSDGVEIPGCEHGTTPTAVGMGCSFQGTWWCVVGNSLPVGMPFKGMRNDSHERPTFTTTGSWIQVDSSRMIWGGATLIREVDGKWQKCSVAN